MIFIGDVHCEFYEYRMMLNTFGEHPTIQLGDMGVGFGPDGSCEGFPDSPEQHRFIRGNHDNPQKCTLLPNYLGDFGYLAEEGIFFVSGAASPDFYERLPHVNWWEEEQLDQRKMHEALALYTKVRPRIVATHDCPLFLLSNMYAKSRIVTSATGRLFDEMFRVHAPKVWVFAHHHKSHHFKNQTTEFFGLKILEALKLTEQEVGVDYLGDDECES